MNIVLLPPNKVARKDIPDLLIDKALVIWNNEPEGSGLFGPQRRAFPDYLIELTGYPAKVVYAALERANKNGIIDYGVSLNFPFAGPRHSTNKERVTS